ncbi:MAG: class I SAM-dependent methyltransferase [Planctomycetia bacterium]|nr:class I SAM-dependent methyltransferase [Planctomycetia bacterium]
MPTPKTTRKKSASVTSSKRSKPEPANWYDYPEYYDLAFADDTPGEADFIAAACAKHALGPVRTMLEPGCGGGRLVVELARRGFHTAGFDNNEKMLAYLKQRIARGKLSATAFAGDMTEFRVPKQVDAIFNTFNTFRHLTTEEAALAHLRSAHRALRKGGLYVLGFHLLPDDASLECIERWTAVRGKTKVTYTLRVVESSRRTRIEKLRVSMLVRSPAKELRLATEFPLRLYTATQFRKLLAAVPEFELCEVYDFCYDIDHPVKFDNELSDAVFILRKR